MSTGSPQAAGAEGILTLALAGAVAVLVVKGSHSSPLRGLLSNPVPRLARGGPGSPATRRPLRRAA